MQKADNAQRKFGKDRGRNGSATPKLFIFSVLSFSGQNEFLEDEVSHRTPQDQGIFVVGKGQQGSQGALRLKKNLDTFVTNRK